VDCIITSPPYGDLKNYGRANQLGYGQHLVKQYLPDMQAVLTELHRIAKIGASLWLVLDAFKTNGEALLLPWELARRAQQCGWTLHDIIVWDKGKSLPWSHDGKFRSVCEFVVLLSKGKIRTFRLNEARDSSDLSDYWVRYPERFNPQGKAPTDLWHIPIPIQGSWAKAAVRHVCPFPVALVTRMLEVSTKKGDVVLDPFAGTGVVPAVSAALGRNGIGVEINGDFVKSFDSAGFDAFHSEISEKTRDGNGRPGQLTRTLVNLRVLKYPKALFVQLCREDRLGTRAIDHVAALVLRDVSNGTTGSATKHYLRGITLDLLLRKDGDISRIEREVAECTNRPPLSKYSIGVRLRIVRPQTWQGRGYTSRLGHSKWYLYQNGRFHDYKTTVDRNGLRSFLLEFSEKSAWKYPIISAPIGLRVQNFD